jgi:hypothetical protein
LNDQTFWLWFPLFFAALWLGVTWLIGLLAGWYGLMERYPDRHEKPALLLRGQSGYMGPLKSRFGGILRFGVCASGLRVGMFRAFGPLSRDFLVPWRDIRVTRKDGWLGVKLAELTFGNPANGTLTITADVADRLAKAAGRDWPEA